MTLLEAFAAACDRVSQTATSSYLGLLREDVAFVEMHAPDAPELVKRVDRLKASLLEVHFALDPAAINTFIHDLAEAQFFALSRSRGVHIRPLPTQVSKGTPDFAYVADETTTFEIKALSIVNGDRGHRENLEHSLDANIEIERQLQLGKRTAFAETESNAFGTKVKSSSVNLDHLIVLLEKARQNIKPDQFAASRSFLVLNLTAIPLLSGQGEDFRPVYWSRDSSPHPVSGAMWMLAFGRPGMAVFGHPEFEGMPGIEGHFAAEGILHEHGWIAGILVVRRDLGGQLHTFLLARASDIGKWSDDVSQWAPVESLVGVKWNDELDSNGWRL